MDIQDSITITVLTFIISLIFFIILLYYWKPNWVKIINNRNERIVDIKLVVLYSFTFSSVISIGVLLCKSKNFITIKELSSFMTTKLPY